MASRTRLMLRPAARIVVALMVLATVVFTTAGSASAGTAQATAAANAPTVTAVQPATTTTDSLSQCPAHSLCMWVNYGYSGGLWYRTWGGTPTGWQYVDSGFNDVASSLYNNRAYESGIDKNYPANLPDYLCFGGGYKIYNMAGQSWSDGSGMNDSVSSYELSGSSSSCTPPG